MIAKQTMDGLRTQKQAERYAREVFSVTGRRQIVFKVPKGTAAYGFGWRFATCFEDEREAYERDGAVFV